MTDKTSNRPPAKEVKQPREMRVTAAAATSLGYGSPSPGGRKTEGGGSPYHPLRDPLPSRERERNKDLPPQPGIEEERTVCHQYAGGLQEI